MPYLTPNSLDSETCYRIHAPGDLLFRAALRGALLELSREYNWEAFGEVTVEEAAEAAFLMYESFAESDCMIGAIFPYATINPPENSLTCDGSQYDRVDYPVLYNRLLAGLIVDGDHFNVPDLRGQFVLGAPGTPLDTGGAATHTLTASEMPIHTHVDIGHSHVVHAHITTLAVEPGEVPVDSPNPFPGVTASASANIQSAGGDGAHNNMPPYTTLKYAIVAR
jgi:microcystin-dependent protein